MERPCQILGAKRNSSVLLRSERSAPSTFQSAPRARHGCGSDPPPQRRQRRNAMVAKSILALAAAAALGTALITTDASAFPGNAGASGIGFPAGFPAVLRVGPFFPRR